jgi:hypothetical protein
MRDSRVLPDLRILPASSLATHEDSDPRRVDKLKERLSQEGRLKNPPIVTPIPGTDRFVVLDGANRTNALTKMGAPHVIAQVVSYGDPGVELDTWYHVVAGMDLAEFEETLTKIFELKLKDCSLEEAREALSTNQAAAYIVKENGVRQVSNSGSQIGHDIGMLNKVVGAYRGRADIYRASNDIWEIQKPYYPEIIALVIFPRLTPSDILKAAREGKKIPSGITRHIIPARALNINIPLRVLEADWTLERKRDWLHEWLMERMASNAIRYYSESTFTFDE